MGIHKPMFHDSSGYERLWITGIMKSKCFTHIGFGGCWCLFFMCRIFMVICLRGKQKASLLADLCADGGSRTHMPRGQSLLRRSRIPIPSHRH